MPRAQAANPAEILVLLSGGLDSMACVDFYLQMGRAVEGLFIDYGQKGIKYEALAAKRIADHYNIKLNTLALKKASTKAKGEIRNRNLFLISTALMECSDKIHGIALGLHSGTNYLDCSHKFIQKSQQLIKLSGINIKLLTPFIEWDKGNIIQYLIQRNAPYKLTYSCESGAQNGCGECLSCLDRRELLDAST
jgi:7-cyano-7-deazaguanine synthase